MPSAVYRYDLKVTVVVGATACSANPQPERVGPSSADAGAAALGTDKSISKVGHPRILIFLIASSRRRTLLLTIFLNIKSLLICL